MRVSLPRIEPERLDRALALGLLVLAQIELWWPHSIPGPMWLAFVLTFTGTLPVAVRRRRPLVALCSSSEPT